MAERADIVIGANFGDEGKGLVTDYLAAKYEDETLVVRHNGGAQAGHTVTTPDGRRHVFKHFGSGSFVCAQTFLSRFFVCNPIIYLQELEKLKALGVDPYVYVDPAAPISTPYDMMINQISEEMRGKGRHGSCGVGFGETVGRSLHPDFVLHYVDLANRDSLRSTLLKIRNEWVPQRLRVLGMDHISAQWAERIGSDRILDWYLDQAQKFMAHTHLAHGNILNSAPHIVFEGAQGLLLDQDGGYFPHVTRSHTGIRNALTLCREADIENVDITYISRAYCTRHGAGPLPHELMGKPYEAIVDETNIHNQYQGSLRFAHLDLDLLSSTIYEDLKHGQDYKNLTFRLGISCMDQVGNDIGFINHGRFEQASPNIFLSKIMERGFDRLLLSYGPTRSTIKEIGSLEVPPTGKMPYEDHLLRV